MLNPWHKSCDVDVQVVFQRQRNRVIQAQHQFAVLHELVNARGVRQHRFFHVHWRVGIDNLRKEEFFARIIRARPESQVAHRIAGRASLGQRPARGLHSGGVLAGWRVLLLRSWLLRGLLLGFLRLRIHWRDNQRSSCQQGRRELR